MTRRRGAILATLAAFGAARPAPAEEINTATILAATYQAIPNCTHIRPVGACFWLRCTWRCRVRTSVKWGSYRPDVVVPSYVQTAQTPWTELRPVMAAIAAGAGAVVGALGGTAPLGGGDQTESKRSEGENLAFRETDAIGHPLGRLAPLPGVSCPARITPLRPYFVSSVDGLAWRLPELELLLYPAAWVPGLREIGHWPLNTWGAVHPRGGFSFHPEPPKAAAVTAQRVGDIVTRRGQAPHLYSALPIGGVSMVGNWRVWPPGVLVETDARTGTWQMLAPRQETSCAAFGTDDVAWPASWSAGRETTRRQYAWQLWRPYTCCRRRGQWFLGSVDWSPYP